MSYTLHIFDLDDCLVQYNKNKICVPRQTFHRFKKQTELTIRVIVSYNPLAHVIVKSVELENFIDYVVNTHVDERWQLIEQILVKYSGYIFDTIHYYDDRMDNIHNVKTKYDFIFTHYILQPSQLFKYI